MPKLKYGFHNKSFILNTFFFLNDLFLYLSIYSEYTSGQLPNSILPLWVGAAVNPPKAMTGIGQLTRGAFRKMDLLWNPYFKSMVNFYIVIALGQNLANSKSCRRKRPKSVISGNLSKNGKWPTSGQLKIYFDPSLNRSWCEIFKMIKKSWSKQSTPGV